MEVLKSPKRLTQIISKIRDEGGRVGLVPTMGCLHEGHLSLVRLARRDSDVVVVSIFVNPTQFGPNEDFNKYPHDLRRDRKLLGREKIDYLFTPSRNSMYPKGVRRVVQPGLVARPLCGRKRPGHFQGVATVVKRLFDIVQPHIAYFGAKDYQQTRVIEEMVRRLKLPVRIKVGRIVRESDRVAMSSRNQYLSKEERLRARSLFDGLNVARRLVRNGERDARRIKQAVRRVLDEKVSRIDYVEIVDPKSLRSIKRVGHSALVALACFIGKTRLIDNVVITR